MIQHSRGSKPATRDPSDMTLGELEIGTTGVITTYAGTARAYRRKLLSMGLTPGTTFRILRIAPMGDPVEIQVRGYKLILRRDEAAGLNVNRA